MTRRLIAAAALLTITAVAAAAAATTTATFQVTANVPGQCSVSATTLSFGSLAALNTQTPVDTQSTVTVHCMPNTPWTAGMNVGTGPNATFGVRRMIGPNSTTLGYNVFRSANDRTADLPWDEANAVRSGIGTGQADVSDVFGRVYPAQLPAAGMYGDTITVTLTF